MAHSSDLIAGPGTTEGDTHLHAQQHQSPLRLMVCGGDLDDLLLQRDGAAERRQGTDSACRTFGTGRRQFIVADVPGLVQSTHDIVMAAATADLMVTVVDARFNLPVQTRRHSRLAALLGVRHVVLAVDKLDSVADGEAVFQRVEADYRNSMARGGLIDADRIVAVPLPGVHASDGTAPGARTPWYQGPTLMHHLETVAADDTRQLQLQARPLRMLVHEVTRDHADRPGYAGRLESGSVRVGQRVRVQPSGRSSTVAHIAAAGGGLPPAVSNRAVSNQAVNSQVVSEQAVSNQAVTLRLADALDAAPGDLISAADSPAEVAGLFNATVVWLYGAPMLPGRGYLLRIGCRAVDAAVLSLRHKLDVDTLEPQPAERLEQGEIGVLEIGVDSPLAFDPYRDGEHTNQATGGFTLVDTISHATVGFGMLNFALRRAHNIHWQTVEVNKAARQRLAGHRSAVLWLTGLSGAGKSTIANLLDQRLHARGVRSYLLDGDNLRHGLNKDLGFTAEARAENIRRVAEVAKLMVDAGVVVIAAFISPFRAERRMARELMGAGEFIEVFVDAPLSVAEQRDVKGLYRKARRGELKNFTGIDSPYEPPDAAEVVIDTTVLSPAGAAELLHERLLALRLLGLD